MTPTEREAADHMANTIERVTAEWLVAGKGPGGHDFHDLIIAAAAYRETCRPVRLVGGTDLAKLRRHADMVSDSVKKHGAVGHYLQSRKKRQ